VIVLTDAFSHAIHYTKVIPGIFRLSDAKKWK